MIIASTKNKNRKKRHRSLRKRVEGTTVRPRLVVFRSTRHIYAQVVNDRDNKTLAAVSDKVLAKAAGGSEAGDKKVDKKARAKQVGAAIAKSCLDKGIDKV